MNLKEKIVLAATQYATDPSFANELELGIYSVAELEVDFQDAFDSPQGQELLRWVAHKGSISGLSSAHQTFDTWWAEFSGEGK